MTSRSSTELYCSQVSSLTHQKHWESHVQVERDWRQTETESGFPPRVLQDELRFTRCVLLILPHSHLVLYHLGVTKPALICIEGKSMEAGILGKIVI